MKFRRKPLLLLLTLTILLTACGALPKGLRPKGGSDGTTVSVTPAGDDKPHTISAVVIVAPVETFRQAIQESGAGLRTGGERKGILVRYGVLDPAAEEFILESLDLQDDSFSPPVGLNNGDEAEIRAGSLPSDRGHYTAHVLPQGSGDRIEKLDLGIVARPSDGSLLPVIRAQIPITGSGTYLVSFDTGAGESFGALLRLQISGIPPATGTRSYRNHRLSVRSYIIKTVDLSRILRLEGVEERGGPGGIVLETLPREQATTLEKGLVVDGKVGPSTNRTLAQTSNTTLQAGGLNLLLRSSFAPLRSIYTTSISVQNRGTLPPLDATHGDRQVLLLIGWDAESPGLSTAALVTLSPVD